MLTTFSSSSFLLPLPVKMVKEVNAESLKTVLDSWEELKKKDDYEKVAGSMVMKL